jgi:hypothetical protein
MYALIYDNLNTGIISNLIQLASNMHIYAY